jgi:hypothetical protein
MSSDGGFKVWLVSAVPVKRTHRPTAKVEDERSTEAALAYASIESGTVLTAAAAIAAIALGLVPVCKA